MSVGNELQVLERELADRRVGFSPLGLEIPEDIGLEGCMALGRKLWRADQVMKWWLADWAAFAERRYGQLKEFAEANGISIGTLQNLGWIGRSVEISRRRENVDFSFFQEVAPLSAAQQTKWLAKVVADELPVAGLRQQIRLSQGERNALVSDGPVVKFGSKSCDDLHHFLQSQPTEFWSEERRSVWKDRLRPIVEFYEQL